MIVAERKCLGMLKIPAKNVIILIESKVVKITGHSRSHSLVLNTQEGNYFCLRKDNDSSTTERTSPSLAVAKWVNPKTYETNSEWGRNQKRKIFNKRFNNNDTDADDYDDVDKEVTIAWRTKCRMMMMLMIKIHDCSDNTLFGKQRVNEPWRICNPYPLLRRLAWRARLFQIAV